MGRAGEGPGRCGEVGRGAARFQDHRCSRCCWLSSSASQSCLSHLIFRGWDHFPFTKSKHGNAAGSQHLQRVWVSRKPCTSGRGVPEMSKSEPEQEARGRRAVACTGASGSVCSFGGHRGIWGEAATRKWHTQGPSCHHRQRETERGGHFLRQEVASSPQTHHENRLAHSLTLA